jgi:hypothetical protein
VRILGWLTDTLRCIWGLLYWNTRKSFFVLGRRRGTCPCQNPSDLGANHGVRCDASLDLNKGLRFRFVCPFVVAGPDGREAFCRVPASQVRPFWGRALAFFGISSVVLYLLLATTVFFGLRATGLTGLTWRQVAWPRAWGEIHQERSRYFFQQALLACARQDYDLAYRSMLTAVAQDRYNYEARLFTAQYSAYADQAIVSDRLFGQVSEEFPSQRDRTAVTQHDTLLAVGRYEALALHCLRQAAAGGEGNLSSWTRSLLLALRLGRLGAGFVAEHQAEFAKLDSAAQRLIQAVAAIADGNAPAAQVSLRHVFASPVDPDIVAQQIQLLLLIGAPVDAEMAWTVNGQNLNAFDRLMARSWIDFGQGYRTLAALSFSSLVNQAKGLADWDKLVATLIMQPDRQAFASLHQRALKEASAVTQDMASLLWLAAVAVEANAERDYWRRYLADVFHAGYPPIERINFQSHQASLVGTVPWLAGSLPLSRNTILSLYWRLEPKVQPPPQAKNK